MTAGLLDTSVVIDWDLPEVAAALPDEVSVSTITVAELATGPHLARTAAERARRLTRLQEVESLFEPLDFDRAAARGYGQVVAAVADAGRSHRPRALDLMIAAIALTHDLPLLTRNAVDLAGLEGLVEVRGV
ncbi:MAG: type II toxin-antitoxin system VapC family toxin [Mycobacteriales bacterium]|nr:type II toxin-antitoxin system VapC family toxin [Mycobacteriales bacterium]